MVININDAVDKMLSVLEYMQSITVQIGGFSTDLLAIELGIILVELVITFIRQFTGGEDL